jgi:hypothetical protein
LKELFFYLRAVYVFIIWSFIVGDEIRSRRSGQSNKPPSYQHKLLQSSKFDGIIPLSYYYGHEAFGQNMPQNPTYPVPRVHMNEGPRRPHHSNGNQLVDPSPFFPDTNASADAEGGSNIIDDTQDKTSTFTPYMGPSEFAIKYCLLKCMDFAAFTRLSLWAYLRFHCSGRGFGCLAIEYGAK